MKPAVKLQGGFPSLVRVSAHLHLRDGNKYDVTNTPALLLRLVVDVLKPNQRVKVNKQLK